ncbi:GMC oxidoreductase (plasmid) [Martelella mediterranea DSM 17316]|uniref:GMC oxidoreductase n=1 Tax=Martelella mediterranea DSM 17316 TaxID=1122214 RepID=A0A1U9ZAE3_9HYPH|nr:GMC oxidoreductase [Martelella mediterranea DSM 17316]
MGENPETSVLDPFNRLWDAQNVLVTNASAFPGSGVAGTTLTVMALTIRACRNLGSDAGSGSSAAYVKNQ